MKLGHIIEASGAPVNLFPVAADISIKLYDGKNRIEENENVKFAENLFVDNTAGTTGYVAFVTYLLSLNSNPVEEMKVMIDEYHVVMNYKTPQEKIFSRKAGGLGPLDIS